MSDKLNQCGSGPSQAKPKDPRALYARILIRFAMLVLGGLALYYLLIPALGIFSPLIWAALLATPIAPLLIRLQKKIKIHLGVLSFVVVILILALLAVPSYFLVKATLDQVQQFAGALQRSNLFDLGDPESVEKINAWIAELPQPISGYLKDLLARVQSGLQTSGSRILNLSVNFGRQLISQTTGIVLWLFTFFIAIFFILFDYERIKQKLGQLMTRPTRKTLILVKDTGIVAVGKYVKGLFYLAVFCTLYMLIAFSLYGYPYSIMLSLFMGVLDILPIVGSLTLLVPWCMLEFVLGNYQFASFLFVTIAIYFVLRKIVEPKLMGTATGLHPLFTLVLFYVTLRYMGVWAAILAPIVVMMLASIYQTGFFDDWLLDLYEFRSRLRVFLRRRRGKSS